MKRSLEGQVIAVTGAGRGIGREIAILCAHLGAAVVVNDLGSAGDGVGMDKGPASDVVAEIAAAGGDAVSNTASITDPAGAESIIASAIEHFGRIDAVVNNAGFLRDTMFHKMTYEDWKAVIDVHLNGYFLVSSAAARRFREQGRGAFVHFSSSSGLVGNFGQANYAAAKMGVVGLSNSIALDMQRWGVRSNCVVPFAWSRMTQSIPASNDAERQRIERLKTMSADKVAPLVAFLCAETSAPITGQVLAIRKNEIFLFGRQVPIRSMHRSDGWTVETLAEHLAPAFGPSMPPLMRSGDMFSWDPI